jgi:hypothetical protein
VEQIRQRLRTEVEKMSQQDIRDGFSIGTEVGMQILQISGANLSDPIQLARNTNLAIIAQG